MTWLSYALITAVTYALFDFFVKRTAGKIDDGLAALIMNFLSFVVLVVYVFIQKLRGVELFSTTGGVSNAITAGVLVGLASITFIKMFSTGSNLSTGVAVVRVGMVILGVLFGVLLLQEKLVSSQYIGLALAILGLGLVMFH